jgi:hypothetical protein
MPPHIIVRIEVTKQAWEEIGSLTEKYGMTQLAMHSRLVEWLSMQPDEVRAAVLGSVLAKTPGAVARLILKNMQRRLLSRE